MWAEERLRREGHEDFKMVYMPVIMNISPHGTNNRELAKHCRVTKQAMSKVAKELQQLGYIRSKIDPADKRSAIFSLTDRGKKLVVRALECVDDISNQYRKLVGVENFEQATVTLKKILDYNDAILLGRK
jgi:DNA-binding MarR family transcriptional regulator